MDKEKQENEKIREIVRRYQETLGQEYVNYINGEIHDYVYISVEKKLALKAMNEILDVYE